ncbi:conserved hypothetical protein [Histoplasma capsulatum G186AR]|uniref:HORMA domain-containing protein n=2 Tax=Ajellomyces capsulatus TaxID=5037 RepID=C0NHA8_AJECG|nr:uncharacterized protein HCBG_02730 [Histoplasma capsulatum G186AR]EEH09193.1 conserved hypothetical protein [Histoplasma capsulatum G186AR]
MARVIFTGAVQQTAGTKMASKTPGVSTTTVMQASAQKEKQKQQAQAITQNQSLALVQIMLHASLSTIWKTENESTSLNEGEENCFDERDLMKLSKPDSFMSYANFIEGGSAGDKLGTNGAGYTSNHNNRGNIQERRAQPLKIIVRGKNPKADKLLDLLEHGIFDAIEKSFLEAVQMTVFVDKTESSHVLESYTFTFKYTGGCKQKGAGDNIGKRLSSVVLESTGCTADMKTVRTARRGLEMIVRRLITLSERYMEIHLFYTEGSPPEYEPPGFKTAEHNDLLFAQNELWSRETQSCGAMETGIHSVGLKISSLKWSGTDYPSSEYVPEIPADIGYSDRVRRDEDVGISDVDTAVRDLGLSTQESSQVSTQTRQDEALKRDLQKMIPLQCAFCKTRQHPSCYGFAHAQDPAIAETQACYKCLLEPQERDLVQDMRTLVLLRRALLVIIEEGYPNRVRDFAQKLNCNGQTIVQITDMLRKQGFLLATPGSKSKGFLEKGLPKFTLSTEPAIKERLRNEIFNPLAKISHHYNLSDNNAVQRYGSVEHSSSDVSTDVLSVEEVPRDSPGYEQRCRERRNGGIAGAVGAMPTPEVNEIRSAWKTLGSSLDFANPVQPKGNSQSPTQAQMQAQMQAQKQKQKRSIMGTELGSGIACGADGEDQARQGFNGIQTQTRPAEWVRDGNDFGSDYGNGEGMVVSGSEEENGNNRRKRVRLSKLGSPISIFEPSSESGVGSGSEGEDGSMCESASV